MNHPVLFSVAFVLTLAMVLTGLALMRHSRREERLRMRLRMANGTYVAHAANGPATPQAGQMLARMVAGIGGRIANSGVLSRKTVEELEKALAVAGMSGRHALGLFIGCKILLLIGLPLVAVVVTQQLDLDQMFSNLLPAAAAVIGLVGPDMVVRRLRDTYVKKVEASLPDAMDMLLICTQAGLPLEPALTRVAQEIAEAHPQIAWEFEQTVQELQMSSDVRVALTNLGERTGLESAEFGKFSVDPRYQSVGIGKNMMNIGQVTSALALALSLSLALLFYLSLLVVSSLTWMCVTDDVM